MWIYSFLEADVLHDTGPAARLRSAAQSATTTTRRLSPVRSRQCRWATTSPLISLGAGDGFSHEQAPGVFVAEALVEQDDVSARDEVGHPCG